MRVQFTNVGKNKKCWEDRVSVPSFEALEHCVKKSGALMSRDIDFDEDPDGMGGRIFAGVRCVGTYTLVPDPPTAMEIDPSPEFRALCQGFSEQRRR